MSARLDAINERLESEPHVFAYVGGRYYDHAYPSRELLDVTDIATDPSHPDYHERYPDMISMLVEHEGLTYVGGGDCGHGSSGHLAVFNERDELVWMVDYGLNPPVEIDFRDDAQFGPHLFIRTDNENEYRLPRNPTVADLTDERWG